MSMEKMKVQVNCKDYDCYYNDPSTKTCKRSGIHASKKSCYCFTDRNTVEE